MDLALVEKDQNFHVHEIKFQQAFTVASNQSMNPKDAILFAMCSTQWHFLKVLASLRYILILH